MNHVLGAPRPYVAYGLMERAGSKIHDLSGNQYDLTAVNGEWKAGGMYFGSTALTRAYSADTVAHNIGTGDVTWHVRTYVDALDTTREGILCNGLYAPAMYTDVGNGQWGLYFGGYKEASSYLSAGNTYNLTAVRRSGTWYFYLDGIADGSEAGATSISNAQMALGNSEYDGTGWEARATVQTAFCWASALTVPQIERLTDDPYGMLQPRSARIYSFPTEVGGTTIECSTGTVTATGLAAGILAGKTIACTTAAVTATGLQATIGAGTTVECSTGAVTAVGLQANISAGKTVSCTLALVAATGLQSSIGTGATIACSTATVAATGLQATIGTGATIECSTATVSATGLQANISAGTTIACTTAPVAVASLAATVQAGGSIQCTTAAVVAVGLQASISASTTIECSTGTVTATGLAATVEDWTYINCTTPAIAVAGLAATLTIGKTISCTTAAVVATGLTASIVDSDVPVGMVSIGFTAAKPGIAVTAKKPTITFTT